MSKNVPIITELGKIWGRDAIYLDEMRQVGAQLVFTGEINGGLCGHNYLGDDFYKYKLTFSLVQAYSYRELDICDWEYTSSFSEIEDSDWVRELGLDRNDKWEKQYGKGYCHFLLFTYDDVYSILAKRFELVVDGRVLKEIKLPME